LRRQGHETLVEVTMRTIGRFLLALPLFTSCTGGGDTTAPTPDLLTVGSSASSAILDAACGDVVASNVRLESDLTCTGDGLTVTGTGITINLNGHSIAGAGVGVGIRVQSSQDVSVHGGTVRGFLQGMFVAGSTGIVIKDNLFAENATAVLLQASSGNTIKANVARGNTARAFMLRPNTAGVVSTNNDIVENTLIDNPTGIYLIRQPGNTFIGNSISGSSVAAIDLDPAPLGASGNVFKGNLLETSGAGIRFADGWTGNTIHGNTIRLNTCAFQGPSAGNTLQGNTLTGNAADFCP
jgi:parallel beta-helix repeat protein